VFRNGHAKLGGRTAGIPNRSTSFVSVRERLEQLDCDPVAEAIAIARDPSTSPELKAKIWLGILDYISPKLRAVDQTIGGPDGEPAQKIEVVRVVFREPRATPVDAEPPPRPFEATKAK
jgi:hypothetical protein